MMTAPVDAITHSPERALVRAILEHPDGHPWVMQEIGLLALRLGDDRVYRLHVWDPASCVGEPPVHDHPFDFTSTVLAGEMVNTVYEEAASGAEYQRDRYTPPDERPTRSDRVRLAGQATTFTAGESYVLRAHQLHSSAQVAGTTTLIQRTFRDVAELTVCRRPGSPWVSGKSRPPSIGEVRRITAAALELMD